MKNKILRAGLMLHKKLPFVPFEKTLIKIYHNLQDKDIIVYKELDGINYQLDLSELIDNKVFYGNWEPKTTAMFKRIIKPNMIVFDVGANMGYYTLLMAKLMNNTGKIISFEPTTKGFKKLEKNVSLNNFKNITLERLALANKKEKVKAKIRYSWKLSGLVEPKEELIQIVKFDDYIKQNKIGKIDFMKIDVDGYEYEVLKGAQKTLKKDKPILCLEMGYYELYKLKEIIIFLKSLEYKFYSEEGKLLTIEKIFESIPLKGAENFLLLPKRYNESLNSINSFKNKDDKNN